MNNKNSIFYSSILLSLIISSCASKNYSNSERIKNNSFTIKCNVQGANVQIKSKQLRDKENFKNTTVDNKNGTYSSVNTFNKLKFRRTFLVVSKENYEPKTVRVWRTPRGKALGKDLLLSLVTYGVPLIVDAFRSDYYQVASWSKEINVDLKFTQEFMDKKYFEILNSITPEPFISYIKTYPYSNKINYAIDKKDSTELLVALEKSTESALNEFISSHQKSKFLKEANEIKAGMVEAREKFEEAKTKNTVEAYEIYISKYPKSFQRKDAINRMVDLAYKKAVSENKITQLTAFNKDYLIKFESNLTQDTLISKTNRLSRALDNLIIKENDTDPKNKYVSYSNLWKKYREISDSNKNLGALEKCEAYLPKISNLLLSEFVKLTDESKQSSYLKKAASDFPIEVKSIESETPLPLINIIVDNAVGYNGTLKLFNQKYVENRVAESSERDVLKSIVGFEYKGEYYANYKDANVEEITLKNGEISNVKLYNGKNLLLTGNYNGSASSECSFYLNGKLVRTNNSDKNGYYSYEFENGVNLSLKNLEDKIKEADSELSKKNFDKAIELYSTNCANEYPKTIALNQRIEKGIQNAKNQKVAYLQKLEQDRIAEEKRREQERIAEEKKREQIRIAEEKKREQERINESKKNNSNSKERWMQERKCSTCSEKFCCSRGYTLNSDGEIKECEYPYSSNICSYECMENAQRKLNNFMDDHFEECDNCFGVGKVASVNPYNGQFENVNCRKCRGTGKLRKN